MKIEWDPAHRRREVILKGSVRLKLKVTFRPNNGCKAKTRTRRVKLVKRNRFRNAS